MPETVVYLTDEQQEKLTDYAQTQGKDLDECIKELADDRMRDKLRTGSRVKAPTFELPKRERRRTDK